MKNMICNVYLTGSSGQSFGMFYFGKDFFVGADIGGIVDEIDSQAIGAPPLVLHGGWSFTLADYDRRFSRHPRSPVVSVRLYR